MSFRERMKDPNLVMRLGLVFLIIALLANRFIHPAAIVNDGWTDGIKGLFYGLAIGLMLLSVYRRSQSCNNNS